MSTSMRLRWGLVDRRLRVFGFALALVIAGLQVVQADEALDRLQQLEQQLKSSRDRLASHEAKADEIIAHLQASEKERAGLSLSIQEDQRKLKSLRLRERQIKSEIAVMERDLRRTEATGTQASAWAFSLGRGGTLELLLSEDGVADRVRHSGLLRAALSAVTNYVQKAETKLLELEQTRELLNQNATAQKRKIATLEKSRAQAASRNKQLQRTLEIVKNDKVMTARLIADLESAQRELTRIISARRRGKVELAPLDPYRKHMAHPVAGKVKMLFGPQLDPVFGVEIQHPGWTYQVAKGTPVIAVAPAEVAYAGWLRGYGNLVVLQHGGEYFTLYGHLDDIFVSQSDQISEGTPIALSGDTGSLYGPALHFEIRQGKDPLDPADWIASR